MPHKQIGVAQHAAEMLSDAGLQRVRSVARLDRWKSTEIMSGSKATLLSPRPLRTRRASFPAARSSLSNALIGTRLAAFTILAWSRRTFRVGGCTNGIFRYHLLFPLSRFARFSREERPEGSLRWSHFSGHECCLAIASFPGLWPKFSLASVL